VTALLEIRDLWIEGRPPGGRYAPIVKGIGLSVNRGEVIALIGESGSGKTTTSLATLGYARPGCRIASGQVFLDGTDILTLAPRARRRLRGLSIAYVAQSAAAAFNPAMTIGSQVTEGAKIHALMPQSEANARAMDLYRKLDLPEPESLGRRYPHQVSGGQLQRLMAAMALSCGPEILVLDEPTTALDVTTQIEVLSAFKEVIQHQHTAAVYVSHDLAVVAQIADRIVVMYDGDVMERGNTDDILHRPQHQYTKTLMAAVRPPPKTRSQSVSRLDIAQPTVGPPILEVKGLTAGYGRFATNIVLRDVDVQVARGEVLGVIGESGCGKSTLARVIAGLLPPLAGQVLHGTVPLAPSAKRRAKEELRRIQIVFQMPDVAVNPKHRVRDILGRPLAYFLGMASAARKQRVAELLEMVELPPAFESRFPAELSGGQKQRVNLARALAARPEVILCDEVTSSLDTVVGAAVIDLLAQLQVRLGVAYMFISHDLSTVASFADRIVVLYAGQVAERGRTADVLAPPYHPSPRLLLSSVPELRRGWLDDVMRTREALSGISRGVQNADGGCPFFNRCPLAIDGVCDKQRPPLRQPRASHEIACHRELAELSGSPTAH